MSTRRKVIQDLIEAKRTSLSEISELFGVTILHAEDEVAHIIKSAKSFKLLIVHAKCNKCEFKFTTRTRLTRPSRCPECKSERITHPKFILK